MALTDIIPKGLIDTAGMSNSIYNFMLLVMICLALAGILLWVWFATQYKYKVFISQPSGDNYYYVTDKAKLVSTGKGNDQIHKLKLKKKKVTIIINDWSSILRVDNKYQVFIQADKEGQYYLMKPNSDRFTFEPIKKDLFVEVAETQRIVNEQFDMKSRLATLMPIISVILIVFIFIVAVFFLTSMVNKLGDKITSATQQIVNAEMSGQQRDMLIIQMANETMTMSRTMRESWPGTIKNPIMVN